jgi:hypothetical protein
LKAAGVVLIVMGALAGCLTLTMVLAMFAPAVRNVPGQDWRAMVVAVAMYVAVAGACVWTGVGSLRIRRWVRPVILSVAWGWLVMGLVTALYWAFAGPGLKHFADAIVNQPPVTGGAPSARAGPTVAPAAPRGMVVAMLAFMGGIWFVFFVALPLAFILTYQGRNARATLEYFDREPSWTDGCPTPVLALSLYLAFAALGTLTLLLYGIIPAFGVILSGPGAVAVIVAVAAAMLAAAWLLYRLRPAGWWATLLLVAVLCASGVMTALRIDWDVYYQRLGYPPQQIEMMHRIGAPSPSGTAGSAAAFAAAGLVYLLYLRRYFRPDRTDVQRMDEAR